MILSRRHRDLRDDNPVVKKTKSCPVATAALGEAKSLPYKIGAAKSRVGEQAVTMNNAVVVAEQRGDNSSSYWRPRAMKAKGQPKAKLVLNVRHGGEQRAVTFGRHGNPYPYPVQTVHGDCHNPGYSNRIHRPCWRAIDGEQPAASQLNGPRANKALNHPRPRFPMQYSLPNNSKTPTAVLADSVFHESGNSPTLNPHASSKQRGQCDPHDIKFVVSDTSATWDIPSPVRPFRQVKASKVDNSIREILDEIDGGGDDWQNVCYGLL